MNTPVRALLSLTLPCLVLADTFSTDLSQLPANATLRDAGLFGGVARLPTATAQGYVDFAFPGFNAANPFHFSADVRWGRGANPPDSIAEVAVDFGDQLVLGFGGADRPQQSSQPMLFYFKGSNPLEPTFVPTPFVFGDGQFHRFEVDFDGVSKVDVHIATPTKTFSQTYTHTFSPTADFVLTMRGVNGQGTFNEFDNLSFSSDGLKIVPEPRIVLLWGCGAVALGVLEFMRPTRNRGASNDRGGPR